MNLINRFFRNKRFVWISATVALTATLGFVRADSNSNSPIFRTFATPDGKIQAATADPTLSGRNKFFDPALGTNGQACVTCHQPADGFDIHVESIQNAFAATGGLDPLFRPNDTADRFDAKVSTVTERQNAYSLFLNLGVIRFARAIKAGANFTVQPQDTPQFGPQPPVVLMDPEAPGVANTLSVFRRPLVNLNVAFDSSLLWDGRESITDLRTQVIKASKSLLLAHDVSNADADDVANFMLKVFVAPVSNATPGAGSLSGNGATGGVLNLLALSSDPAQPCRYDKNGAPTQSVTPFLVLTPGGSCTPVVPNNPNTVTVYDAWANLPNTPTNAARLSVARGQKIFNTARLHVPTDLVGQFGAADIHCVTCHAVNNVGNHPDANFFARIGTDSVPILQDLVTTNPEVKSLLDRVKMLPQYCLRPASDTLTGDCGTHGTDVLTTDPGRAFVTGNIADVGKFKPPVLRGFGARAPYFHNGAAIEDDQLVDFYNARFQIGLSDQDHEDLVAFLVSF